MCEFECMSDRMSPFGTSFCTSAKKRRIKTEITLIQEKKWSKNNCFKEGIVLCELVLNLTRKYFLLIFTKNCQLIFVLCSASQSGGSDEDSEECSTKT